MDKCKTNKEKESVVKKCKKCGFIGTQYPHFKRTTINGIHQYANCKTCTKHARRGWSYGMTSEQLTEFLKDKNNCKLCSKEIKDNGSKGTRRVIDHCHTTNKVRGVLCDNCNVFVGRLEKRKDILNKYLDYIKK